MTTDFTYPSVYQCSLVSVYPLIILAIMSKVHYLCWMSSSIFHFRLTRLKFSQDILDRCGQWLRQSLEGRRGKEHPRCRQSLSSPPSYRYTQFLPVISLYLTSLLLPSLCTHDCSLIQSLNAHLILFIQSLNRPFSFHPVTEQTFFFSSSHWTYILFPYIRLLFTHP